MYKDHKTWAISSLHISAHSLKSSSPRYRRKWYELVDDVKPRAFDSTSEELVYNLPLLSGLSSFLPSDPVAVPYPLRSTSYPTCRSSRTNRSSSWNSRTKRCAWAPRWNCGVR
uniref:Uncharacterized protein n=1 Tax=Steinernema glaseri TaxID=37863 RepID=A0A1I7ZCP1_9BILA